MHRTKVSGIPDTVIALVEVLILFSLPYHLTPWVVSALLLVLKALCCLSISVPLFSYRNRNPNMMLDTRMPRIKTTFPRVHCNKVWPLIIF